MRITTAIGIGAIILTAAARSRAADVGFESIGARFGYSSAESTKDFHQYDIFTDLRLPWRWTVCTTNWYVLPQAEISAGSLNKHGQYSFIGSAGPRFLFGHERFPVTVFLGSGPTFLSRYDFEDRDFGIHFQFTTYVGVGLDIGRRFNVSYRAQHMSNGGLGSPNPGLNLQTFSFSYRF